MVSIMKIAIAGKGGSGKTTISAGLARAFADAGRPVLAVDADSNNCLGYALGFPPDLVDAVTPLSEMIRRRGYDVDTVLDEIKSSNDAIDERELVLDSDPRKVTQQGLAQNDPSGDPVPPPKQKQTLKRIEYDENGRIAAVREVA